MVAYLNVRKMPLYTLVIVHLVCRNVEIRVGGTSAGPPFNDIPLAVHSCSKSTTHTRDKKLKLKFAKKRKTNYKHTETGDGKKIPKHRAQRAERLRETSSSRVE